MIKKITIVATICILLLVYQDLPIANCHETVNANINDLSWSKWLKADNQSYLSHFLELIELLYGNNEQSLL
ncbi:hypothetical protein [Paraferrimonas sp. SM1919]|uniref:hypothetical protein n=1 Tax=Paraferrimonas sp. SM1919 TaxID=2662263 RepID=UPI0013D3B3C2|nr:hypothetical protein [Paraferrimonas sp. SM1919]